MNPTEAFRGSTYSPVEDYTRLKGSQRRVIAFLQDGHWRTLAEISRAVGSPEASVSARIRDCRRPEWGGWIVESRRRSKGLWEYRMRKPEIVQGALWER